MASKRKSPKKTSKKKSAAEKAPQKDPVPTSESEIPPKRPRGRPPKVPPPPIEAVDALLSYTPVKPPSERLAAHQSWLDGLGHPPESPKRENLEHVCLAALAKLEATYRDMQKCAAQEWYDILPVAVGADPELAKEFERRRGEFEGLDEVAQAELAQQLMIERILRVSDASAATNNSPTTTTVGHSTKALRGGKTKALRDAKDIFAEIPIRGGKYFESSALYRAFAILMDLMREATNGAASAAKPDCIDTTIANFIDLMDGHAAKRAEAAAWTAPLSVRPALREFFGAVERDWPREQTSLPLNGGARVPDKPSVDEQAAIKRQEEKLRRIVSNSGCLLDESEREKFIRRTIASPLYISHTSAKNGPANLASKAAGDLFSYSLSTVAHRPKDKRHVDMTAATVGRGALISDKQDVTWWNVFHAQQVAREARSYVLRHLLAVTTPGGDTIYQREYLDDFYVNVRETAAACHFGIPVSAIRQTSLTPICTLHEFLSWELDPDDNPVPHEALAKPLGSLENR